MKMKLNLIFLAFVLCFGQASFRILINSSSDKSQIHAVLVGGGAGVDTDYVDQANVCHAYHVLINHGVLPENIILMIVDDVAYSPDNPFPGKLFNEPNGTDVYAGCIKDYTGNDVNPDIFMKVLKGDQQLAKKGNKVLTSGPEDHVFIYFTDHGSVGAVYFQEATLTSHLNETLTYMYENKMYGKLTFYLEACESGSMFENNLSPNISIYAITSANPGELGWATYCDVPGFPFCLSDEFSASWMPDTEHHDITKETLETQYERVVKKVARSHPQQYGDKSLANLMISQFQGASKLEQNSQPKQINSFTSVNKRDQALYYWKRRLEFASEDEYNQIDSKLSSIIAGRRFYDKAIRRVLGQLCKVGFCSNVDSVLNSRLTLFNHKAFSLLVKRFESRCINPAINTYTQKYMYAFANIIESKGNLTDDKLQLMLTTLEKACVRFIVNHEFDAIV